MTEIIDVELTPEEIAEREAWAAGAYDRAVAETERQRQAAYQAEADPLYFQWQAGESTEEVWQLKREEIRERYPYPTNEEVK